MKAGYTEASAANIAVTGLQIALGMPQLQIFAEGRGTMTSRILKHPAPSAAFQPEACAKQSAMLLQIA